MNLAIQYLQSQNETIEDWDGICGELAAAILLRHPGQLLYVDGEIGWRYHMVPVVDGLVHDAWFNGDPLPIREWLMEAFGKKAYVELMIAGKDVFAGQAEDYR